RRWRPGAGAGHAWARHLGAGRHRAIAGHGPRGACGRSAAVPARAGAPDNHLCAAGVVRRGRVLRAQPAAGRTLDFYLPEASAREATVTVKSGTNAVRHFNTPIHAGLNQAMWDLHYGP